MRTLNVYCNKCGQPILTGWQGARIIAWMPLPLPYEEAENE